MSDDIVRVPDALCDYLDLDTGCKMNLQVLLKKIETSITGSKKKTTSSQKVAAPVQAAKKDDIFHISSNLCQMLGLPDDTHLTRKDAVSRTISYIKKRGLVSPTDHSVFIPNTQMMNLFRRDLDYTIPNLKQHLAAHLHPPTNVTTHVKMEKEVKAINFHQIVNEKVKLTEELADFLRLQTNVYYDRQKVTNMIITYIKDHELDVKPEMYFFIPDKKLSSLLEPKLNGVTDFSFINLQMHLAKHFSK